MGTTMPTKLVDFKPQKLISKDKPRSIDKRPQVVEYGPQTDVVENTEYNV